MHRWPKMIVVVYQLIDWRLDQYTGCDIQLLLLLSSAR